MWRPDGPRRLRLWRALAAKPGAFLPGFVVGGLLIPGAVMAAPQTFNTALPVARGEFLLRAQVVRAGSGEDPGPAARDRTAWVVASVAGYGVSPDLVLFGVVPYVRTGLELTAGGARRMRKAGGLGDVKVFGRYTVFARNRLGASFRLAPFAGLELPTGDHRRRDALGPLPAAVQPGSGSWDPFAGLVVTYQTLGYQFDAQASYKANTQAGGFAFGDVARVDASFQYRLWPRRLKGGVPAFLYGGLEMNVVHQQRNSVAGVSDPNSGGLRVFLAPSVQFVTKRVVLEAVVQIPVRQSLHGTALEAGTVLRTGFRINL